MASYSKEFEKEMGLWETALIKKGHTPILYEGQLDIFVLDVGHHNGPGCSVCRDMWCWHCMKNPEDLPECTGSEN